MERLYPYGFIVTYIWIGFVVAISFMEAPLKFQAPSVTTQIGVEIGSIIFRALNKVELIFSLLLIFTLSKVKKCSENLFWGILFLLIIVITQTVYLLPTLDRYAQIVIDGGTSPSNTEHVIYVIFEVLKLIFLIYISVQQISLFKNLLRRQSLMDFELD